MTTRHVIAIADEVPDRRPMRVEAGGKALCLVRVDDEFFALLDRCPHAGAQLSGGRMAGTVESDGPGHYRPCRKDELLRCPWHGWEFDLKTGQSWSDPKSTRARAVKASAMGGDDLVKGPYKADTVPVEQDGRYVVVELR